MSSSTRPPARRGPSGAWGRLRAPQIDPLDVYGLPSKGETRLSDFKTQEQYFERIVSRYMKFCASCGDGERLEAAFQSLSLSQDQDRDQIQPTTTTATSTTSLPTITTTTSLPTTTTTTSLPTTTTSTTTPTPTSAPTEELSTLLMSMRKLREALVSTHRHDTFAHRAYTFIIRSCILCRHLESYHPSLLHLLDRIHPYTPLSPPEVQEFAGYLVLDLACRQSDLSEAFRVKRKWGVKDRKVDKVLKSLVRGDWCGFWRMGRAVDGYQRCLLSWADQGMRLHALKCLGKGYMVADKAFVERVAGAEWDVLVERDKVGWVLGENGLVTIRKVKGR